MSIPCTENTRRAELYRKAARLLELRAQSIWPKGDIVTFACEALETALGKWLEDGECQACVDMRSVFAPNEHRGAWLAGIGDYDDDAERDGRIVALCFMAAMVEAGDA